jgi:hypothetical protein
MAPSTPPRGDGFEFLEHGFFDQVGQLVDDEGALVRVLVLRQAPLAVDDQLDGHRAAHDSSVGVVIASS